MDSGFPSLSHVTVLMCERRSCVPSESLATASAYERRLVPVYHLAFDEMPFPTKEFRLLVEENPPFGAVP